MKRKLIRRNKKFLSSRYRKYGNGDVTFQPMYSYPMYDVGGKLITKTKRTRWMWFYSEKWILDNFYGGKE